jgi:hypothetical protein
MPPSAKGLTAAKIEHQDKVQAMTQSALVELFNPHHGECPHVVLCHYFGNKFIEVAHCCEQCDHGLLESHLAMVKEYMAKGQKRASKLAACLDRTSVTSRRTLVST